jgi:LysM repeat protein
MRIGIRFIIFGALPLYLVSCSPLRTSPHDEKHQWELKLHEVQTQLEDLRHDTNCFQTELQILDGRIKYYENALSNLKQQDLEKQQLKINQMLTDLALLEKKWASFEKLQQNSKEELRQLATHANETTSSLTQFKHRIEELEQDLLSQNRRFDDLAKIKTTIESLAKSSKPSYKIYRVRAGDSLEKIAQAHQVKIEQIKKLNHLEKDLIVIGQELKIPSE